MNKKEFMQKLKDNLIGLNQTDKREVLLDYEEHFMDGKNQGRTEEEICESLGDPKEIAQEIKNQNRQSAPSSDGVNMAGYIIGIILLSGACIALVSILFSVLAGAVSGIFGAVAVATIFSNPMLKIAAVSAVILAIALCVLIALGIIKLIPLVIKWYKQLFYSLDGKTEKAKSVQNKKIKIHAIFWILLSIICIASICGMIVGSIGFAKDVAQDFDVEDIYEFRDTVREFAGTHRGWVYYSGENIEEFEDVMEEFADDMEEFGDNIERTYDHHGGWFFVWKYFFD